MSLGATLTDIHEPEFHFILYRRATGTVILRYEDFSSMKSCASRYAEKELVEELNNQGYDVCTLVWHHRLFKFDSIKYVYNEFYRTKINLAVTNVSPCTDFIE